MVLNVGALLNKEHVPVLVFEYKTNSTLAHVNGDLQEIRECLCVCLFQRLFCYSGPGDELR